MKDRNARQLPERLKQERLRQGMTQADLAAAVGIAKKSQTNYELGHTVPGIDYVMHLHALGFDVEFLLTGEVGWSRGSEEARLLKAFQCAGPELRSALLAIADASLAVTESSGGPQRQRARSRAPRQ